MGHAFGILGPFQAVIDGVDVTPRAPKDRALLAILVISHGHVVGADRLIEELWPDLPADRGRHALQVRVAALRKVLNETADGKPVLQFVRPGYRLAVAAEDIDRHRYSTLVERARDRSQLGDPTAALALFREALGLWRGVPLADMQACLILEAEATRLAEQHRTVLEEVVDAELACGRHHDMIDPLEAMVSDDPFRERRWALLMLALYRCGRQVDALRALQRARAALDRLGVEPGPELCSMERCISVHDASLEIDDTTRTSALATTASRPQAPVVTGPSGTVTFLLTDIEDSTRLWEDHPAAMDAALRIHDEIVRRCAASHGGYVFSTSGDAFAIAFPTAQGALDTAVDAQRALAGHTWPDPVRLKVRMGLHTGEAIEREGDYFGPPVNVAARLMRVAHGGQILCSDVTTRLVRDRAPMRDVGLVRLKDVRSPEQVYQPVALGLPDEFPPLPAAGIVNPRHNLPTGLTQFVGRSRELEEIETLMVTSRLLTLTGVGGAGKTRLSIHAAAAAFERYPDGVRLIELGGLQDSTAIPFALTEALGIVAKGYQGSDAVENAVCTYLASRRQLLVFDNCEHLLGAIAQLVHRVLARCPGVSVLASSRERLGVPGEVTFTVPPLSLPPPATTDTASLTAFDSVALFCQRARQARPQFELSATNAHDVARICRRLDGIPLALELAAARVGMLSVAQIATHIDESSRLLSVGPRTVEPRHQTLRAALDWSHDLLSPAEQAAFRRLAVFPDRFDLAAAVSVVTCESPSEPRPVDEVDGLELISRLVDKSLVVVEPDGDEVRYRLLQPIREYAADKLAAADETAAAHDRHRDHFLAHATQWKSQMWLTQTRRLFADRANYRAALDWAWRERDIEATLGLVVLLGGPWLRAGDPQGRQWIERVLAEPELGDHWALAEALTDLAFMIHDSDQPDAEHEDRLLREGAAMARRLGDESALAFVEAGYGELQVAAGRTGEARSLVESALSRYERLGSIASVGWCHEHLGWIAVAEQDHQRARVHFERAAELARTHDDGGWLAAHALASLAPMTLLLGEPERAVALAEEAISDARGAAEQNILVMALTRAAETMILARQGRRAGEILEELLGLLHDMGSRRWLADALEIGALVLESRGDRGAAVEVLLVAERLRGASGEQGGGVRALTAEVRAGRERLVAAVGPARFAEHEAQCGNLSPEAAAAELLARLRAGP